MLLFVTLFQGNSHLVIGETLHICSQSSQQIYYSSCTTLSQFANNQASYTRANTTLIFYGGNHTLTTGIVVSNVIAFSMLDLSNAAIINCHDRANMTFTNVSEVYMCGLTFIGCGGNTVDSVNFLAIEHTKLHAKNGSSTSIQIIESIAVITSTNFSLNTNGSYRSDIEYSRLIPRWFPQLPVPINITVGGALIITNSTLSIDNCGFDRNSANIGGAVFVESESKVDCHQKLYLHF